ncbi:MAG: hypothetical protein ABIH46_11670 [Chloroflexota bacterium]
MNARNRVVVALIVGLALALVAMPALAAQGNGGTNFTAEALALLLAGVIGSALSEILKKVFGNVDGPKALYLTMAVSVVLAGGAMWLTGELGFSDGVPTGSPVEFISWLLEIGAAVFAVATVVYKKLIDPIAEEPAELIPDSPF